MLDVPVSSQPSPHIPLINTITYPSAQSQPFPQLLNYAELARHPLKVERILSQYVYKSSQEAG